VRDQSCAGVYTIDIYVQRFTVMYIVKRKIKDWRLP